MNISGGIGSIILLITKNTKMQTTQVRWGRGGHELKYLEVLADISWRRIEILINFKHGLIKFVKKYIC